MTYRRAIRFISVIGVVLFGTAGLAQTERGVVVRDVATNSEGARAGLKNGDVVLSWSCGEVGGEFLNPFEFRRVAEGRHTCKSRLKLVGRSAEEERHWLLGQADWGIQVRPAFTGNALFLYNEGSRSAADNKLPEAVERWSQIEGQNESSPELLKTWLALHGAELFAGKKQWKDTDQQYERAVLLARRAGPSVAAQVLDAWAETFLDRSDWNNAEKYYQQALDETKKAGTESLSVAKYLNGLSTIALRQGDLAMAEQYSRRDLAMTERLAPDSLSLAATLTNLGGIALRRGELTEAEKHYRRSLSISERLAPNSLDLAFGLNNFASLLAARGQLSNAEEYYGRSLAVVEKISPHSLEAAGCLHNLGTMARQRGDLDASDAYLKRALDIKEKLAGRSVTTATTLINLGRVAYQREQLAAAETWLRQSMSLLAEVAPDSLVMAENLSSIGDICRSRGDLTTAKSYYKQALEIRERLAPGNRSHAENLAGLAQLTLQTGDSNAAASFYERFLTALESQAARLGGGEEVRHGFRVRYGPHYEGYINLLMAQQQIAAGFQVVERWRAQTLLETLASGRVSIRKGVEVQLVEQERSLRELLAHKRDQRLRLMTNKRAEAELARIDHEIRDLVEKRDLLESEIREHSPSYAGLIRPWTLGVRQVQEELLDNQTVLLEYCLGHEQSHVWAVTSDSVTVSELPARATIEGAARRLYELLIAPKRQRQPGSVERATVDEAEADYPRVAAELTRLVLGPVAERIKGKRLLIVSDGALQYIPFAALPEPRGSDRLHDPAVPLIVEHEIINLPSASVLAQLRREDANRRKAPKAIAVLADPVFDASDNRVKVAERGEAVISRRPKSSPTPDNLNRSVPELGSDDGIVRLQRLIFTREEANSIMAVARSQPHLLALDFKANRATAISKELSQYRIVHFATHGVLDNARPEMSGLALSMVDGAGEPQNGFLGLEDVYNLDLPADLVVLSGCETGLGKEIRGEGLIGLTRGFMYAGAVRVIASLWGVDDFATAELFGRFYRNMMKTRMRPAAALRDAQIQMWKTKRWNFPFYWAAFQIHGEWK